jgi:hypothetical protein
MPGGNKYMQFYIKLVSDDIIYVSIQLWQPLISSINKLYLLNFRSKKAIICSQAEVAATAS